MSSIGTYTFEQLLGAQALFGLQGQQQFQVDSTGLEGLGALGALGGPLDVARNVTDWWGITTRTYSTDPNAPSATETNVLGEVSSAVASAKEQAYQGYFANADRALMQATRAYNTLTDTRYKAKAQALIEEGDRYVADQRHVQRTAPELTREHRSAFDKRVKTAQSAAIEETRRARGDPCAGLGPFDQLKCEAGLWWKENKGKVALAIGGLLAVGYASGGLAKLFRGR